MTKTIELAAKAFSVSPLSLLVFIALDSIWSVVELPAAFTIVGLFPLMIPIAVAAFIAVFSLELFIAKKTKSEAFSIALALAIVAAVPTFICSYLFGGAKFAASTIKVVLHKFEKEANPPISATVPPK